jgi:hypothetical protein
MKRVVLVGATGVFGRRLARHLVGIGGIELVLTSRTAEKAEALAGELASAGTTIVRGAALDRERDLVASLAALAPWLVIDASGPFQGAGYDVPTAALLLGAHVVDLADARDYLLGYPAALDELARKRDLVALAGASSTPALSAAAARDVTAGWRRIDSIDIAITPGGRSEVGPAVIAAVLSYAGKPVPIWREGQLQAVDGWSSGEVVEMPGLGARRIAPVETVDAEVLGPGLAVRSRVGFSAGLEAGIEQWGLALLARLRRRGWLADPQRLLPWLLKGRQVTRLWTSDRGSMCVFASGLDGKGRPRAAYWSLLAENDDGPQVPTLAAAAAVRALLAGALQPGARSAAEALDLAMIEAEMAPYSLTTSQDEIGLGTAVFERALGEADFMALPPAIRAFHEATAPPVWQGLAEVEQGEGQVARLLCRIFGLPDAGRDLPLTVSVERGEDAAGAHESWTRNFAGRRFSSRLEVDRRGELYESCGPFRFRLAPKVGPNGLSLPIAGWSLFGLALPRALMPRSEAREQVDEDGRFRFDVRLTLPYFGLLAHYRGWLSPKP